jgi:hypothetical protein
VVRYGIPAVRRARAVTLTNATGRTDNRGLMGWAEIAPRSPTVRYPSAPQRGRWRGALSAGGCISVQSTARVAGVLLLLLQVRCGSSAPEKVNCTELDPGSHSCFCGTDVRSTDPHNVSSCDTSTVVGVSACCAYLNSTKDCVCKSYTCGYVGTDGTGTCDCYSGNSPATPANVCTGTHCCQSPQQPQDSPIAGSCSCYTTPCTNGSTEVTSCPQSSPAFDCPIGLVPVSDCLSY